MGGGMSDDKLLASYVLQLERRIEALEIEMQRWNRFSARLDRMYEEATAVQDKLEKMLKP
jgi:hypothetical protein